MVAKLSDAGFQESLHRLKNFGHDEQSFTTSRSAFWVPAELAQDARRGQVSRQDLLPEAGLSPYTVSSSHARSRGREASDDPATSQEAYGDHDGLDKIGKRIQRELQRAQVRRKALKDEIERGKAKRQVLEKDAEKMRELLEYFQKIRQRT